MLDQPKPHQIYIHCIEGRGIDAVENKRGLSDLQCNITVGPTLRLKRTTYTKFQTANSVWNEKFVFENVMLTDQQWEREKIALTVVDRNDFTTNAMIGTVEFSLTNIYRQNNHEYYRKWAPLVKPDEPGKDHGWIQVSVYVLKKGDATPSHADSEFEAIHDKEPVLRAPTDLRQSMFVLNVLLYRAEGLLATHKKALNPFVSVRFNGATMQTKRMANIRNPIWNRKIMMPFQLPLHSDSIEIQVWNDNSMAPDTLIGQKTFSFHGERLQNRPYGPAWINLYSSDYVPPKTTFLGRIMDILGRSQYVGEDEFVGRLLARVSVRRVNAALNPRLRCIPCPPAVEPRGVEYVLDFFAYCASEIPVQGGKVFVEVVFGANRFCTEKLIAANAGEYAWNQVFGNMSAFGPEELSEVHDVIINVYHQAGYASRKIAFERIPVKSLVQNPKRISYCIDGRPFHGLNMPPPRWRALQNISYDENKPHIIAGFLLCSIGFGLKHQRPLNLPKSIQKSIIKKYVLRVYMYQGVNLPAASDDGSISPFVLVRFAGRHMLIEAPEKPTKYPYYFQMVEIEADVDPAHVPSVNLMVYHRVTGGQQLVGRCEVLSGDILPPADLAKVKYGRRSHNPMITKYPLQVVNVLGDSKKERLNSAKSQEDDVAPCLVAQIQLVEKYDAPQLIPGWARTKDGAEFKDPFLLPSKETKSVSIMNPYTLTFKCVGLRDMKGTGYENIARPRIEVFLPPAWEKSNISPVKFESIKVDSNGTADIMEARVFDQIPVPKYSLNTTPLVIGLYDGSTLISSTYIPLSKFTGGTKYDAPTYHPTYDRKTGRPREFKSIATVMDEVRANEILEKRKKAVTEANNDEEKEKRKPKRRKGDFLLLSEECNIFVEKAGGDGQFEQDDEGEVKEDEEGKAVVASEMETWEKYNETADPFHYEFKLYRGKQVGISSSKVKEMMLKGDGDTSNIQDAVGKVKAFVQLVPSKEGKEGQAVISKLMNQDHLGSYRSLQQNAYVTRVYVYRAFNLSPRMHLNTPTCNPYLVVSNGLDESNKFSNVKSAEKDKLNPLIYQLIELQTEFPENGQLEIEIRDNDPLGTDAMIGRTTIDLEQRLIHKMERGEKEYRRLLNPAYSTSQGLILVKVDILKADQARLIKADEISPPQLMDYQLRVVLWSTYGIKFPQLENRGLDVDQKLIVTANFDGEKGEDIIKYTDVAWYAAEGCADWNWRMIFDVKLPSKNPRLRIAVWDENLLKSNEALGEVILNLSSFFSKCLLEKSARTKDKPRIVSFEHASFKGVDVGSLKLEMSMYTKAEADENPAGEAQNEPNVDPYLPNPKRNSPPWAVGTRTLDWIAGRRRLFLCICITVIIGALFIPVLYIAFVTSS